MALNVVLIEPEIPQNTGNIARTCAATGAKLHLVGPLGFSIDAAAVRRAGLDYWDKVQIYQHTQISTFLEAEGDEKCFFTSAQGMHRYDTVEYPDECYLVFGKESTGLPHDLLNHYQHRSIYVPMLPRIRSLNLSNSVAILVYEILRQKGFSEFCENHRLEP